MCVINVHTICNLLFDQAISKPACILPFLPDKEIEPFQAGSRLPGNWRFYPSLALAPIVFRRLSRPLLAIERDG